MALLRPPRACGRVPEGLPGGARIGRIAGFAAGPLSLAWPSTMTGMPQPMEINPLRNQLADLKARTDALRGYL